MEKAIDNSLGKLTSGKELTLAAAPPSLQPSSNGRVHPSWWRPDLVKPTPAQEDPSSSEYRRKKAEGKQVVNPSSKHVWRRRDISRPQNWNPPDKAHYSSRHENKDATQGYDRRGARNTAPSTAPIPRTREKPMKQLGNKLPPPKDSGRKRRYDDTLEEPNRKPPASKERAVTRGKGQDKPQAVAALSAGLSHVSDSQLTVSDPLISSLRAKQGVSSPALNRERPFRLKLTKRSGSNQMELGKDNGKSTIGDSSDTGSSAKKSLNFDVIPTEDEDLASRDRSAAKETLNLHSKEKSWYEQTVEEEARAASEAPLETRFTNSIKIQDDLTSNPKDDEIANPDLVMETEEAWYEDEYMDEDGNDTNQNEVEEGEMEWAENAEEEDRVDLEWEEEDETAYHESAKSLLEAGENMEDDDLLGEEFDEMKNTAVEIDGKDEEKRNPLPPNLGLGLSKQKGKKKDKAKKIPTPKAQSGQASVHGAASKKIFNLQGRFSPKTQNVVANNAKPNQKNKTAKPTIDTETKNDFHHLQNLQVSLGFDSLLTVEPVGNSGGLALLFLKDFPVKLLSCNDRIMDIETIIDGNRVFISFVYGDPVVQNRENVWERLTRIGINRDGPWFMIGDFNEITGSHEKRGGRRRSESSFLPFRTMIHNCGMIEFPYQGNPFSWVGRRKCGKKSSLVKLRLDRALAQNDENVSAEDLLAIKWQLCGAYRDEDTFWKQKSRALWYKEGDLNTKYFHATTKQRRARNRIIGLLDENGCWIDKDSGIESLAVNYFQTLFTTSNPIDFSSVIRDIPETITEEMNEMLTKVVSLEEVRRALFSLNPDKTPGPDGLTAAFYQKFWDIVGEDLFHLVKDFFVSGTFDSRLNETNICLIPKTDRPRSMTEFRPISLCNVAYKVISKVLSSRLKKILPDMISETQSAFVAGRLITDNILIAQENFHALRSNAACKKKFMAIKTDMSKAFDRVEWQFLRALMEKMGFSGAWIERVMFCVSSVSYKVILNGTPRGVIKPTRGIRQGDPISPFLFILCTEALIAQLRSAEWNGHIQGLQVSKASPSTSHLLFADDSLFFCKAEENQGKAVIDIIRAYGEASGQQLNFRKSSVMFGKDVDNQTRSTIKRTLGISTEGGMGTYLGLPEKIHGSKTQVFSFVRDRLHSRLNTWSAKFLSKGGKEILIKSVAQALPTYVMSCFLLPKAISSKLKSAIADFWWKTRADSKGIHWIAWDKLCTQLSEGGLGFRTLEEFNLALLAKQLWRLIKFPNSLLSRVLRGRYYRYSDPLEIKKSNRPSYGWRSIMASKPLLTSGLRRTIGSGMNTRVWLDPWIPDIPARPAKGKTTERDPHLYVDHFIDPVSKHWKLDRLQALIDPSDIPLILSIRPSRTYLSDGYSWNGTKSGNYSVKSGYWAARELSRPICDHPFQGPGITSLLAQVWKLKTTRKLKHFVWQCLSGCLATNHTLFYRHIGKEKHCSRCGAEEETINHLLFECPPALQTWALSPIPSLPSCFPSQSLFSNLDFLFWRAKGLMNGEEIGHIFPWILWYLWKARNSFIFENVRESPQSTLDHAFQEAKDWKMANTPDDLLVELERLPLNPPVSEDTPPECQIDGSWHATDTLSGHGWIVLDKESPILLGLKSSRRGLSPLQAEFETLLWAMECLISESMTSFGFATDCSELISILDNPSEWPTLAVELQSFKLLKPSFPSFSIRFIPRCNNFRADCLAKKARARGSLFSHVSTSAPDWLSLEESLRPTT
ncbi:Reverse transcriptase domain [Arabidopsis thaliana x Arabidopsis arenosa]|uniref:Reverse transcriptase domain n=1 Tax=Arabidopsis thaliana x Arabidopsis arenosa TaxID=1240361 RepID=A0A8T1Y7V1_9BRAS|nr:Reverse transcriptase domain [Arabidopsis thaliana x Arabidopsis arenosa]